MWNHPETFLAGAIEMSANAESGPAIAPAGVALTQVAQDIEAAGVTLSCDSSNPTLDCLRELDPDVLLQFDLQHLVLSDRGQHHPLL